MIDEKRQQLGDGNSMIHGREPSAPSRHEKWKRARQRPNGEYTLVAEKIVSRT